MKISQGINTPMPIKANTNFSIQKKEKGPQESFSSMGKPLEIMPKSLPQQTKQPKAISHGETQKSKKANPEDYHYKPPYNVHQNGSGQWILELPNTQVTVPRKPVWLETMNKINDILDKSENPTQLRKYTDGIKEIADNTYDSTNQSLDSEKLNNYINEIKEPKMIDDLTTIYQMRLDDETQSTNLSGALAGNGCSEMKKYGHIMNGLKSKQSQFKK